MLYDDANMLFLGFSAIKNNFWWIPAVTVWRIQQKYSLHQFPIFFFCVSINFLGEGTYDKGETEYAMQGHDTPYIQYRPIKVSWVLHIQTSQSYLI